MMHHKGKFGPHQDMMFKDLNLTDAQKQQIREIMKGQRVVGEFDFIEPDFPHRGRQHSGNRKATIVRLAREVAFLTFQSR